MASSIDPQDTQSPLSSPEISTPDIYRPNPILAPSSVASSNDTSVAPPSTGKQAYNADRTVYVSELDKATTEHDLFDFFAHIGPVQSVKIVKDQLSKRPLGYAYVNFQQPDHAKAALEMDLKSIRGKPCRVKPFQKDPTSTHHAKTKIFVSNLSSSITEKELTDLFAPYGTIVSCFIPLDTIKNKPRGFAHIQYDTPEAAEKAIKALKGYDFQGSKLYVKHHFSKYDKAANIVEHKANFTNIYVKNIDRQVTEDQFRQLFEKYGTVVSLSLPLDDENLSRGFGFVNYETHEQAVAAVNALHDSELNGKRLYVCRTQKKYEREEELRQTYETGRNQYIAKYASTNLYIKNLDQAVDQDVLYKEFSSFGHITSAKVMTDDNGVSKGFGFVCYSNSDEAQQAINGKNDTELMGQTISVSLAKRRQSSTNASQAPSLISINPYLLGNSFYPPQPVFSSGSKSESHSPYGTPNLHQSPIFSADYSFQQSRKDSTRGFQYYIPMQPTFLVGNPAAGGANGYRHASVSPGMPVFGPNGEPLLISAGAPATVPFVYPGGNGGYRKPRHHSHHRHNGVNSRSPSNSSSSLSRDEEYADERYHAHHHLGGARGKGSTTSLAKQALSSMTATAPSDAADEEELKQVVGKQLYDQIQVHPAVKGDLDLTAKLTGMILGLGSAEYSKWIDDKSALTAHIQQAHDQYMQFLKDTAADAAAGTASKS